MRKALTLALTVALATSLASPLTVLAQSAINTPAPAGTLTGRSVDAMGRGVFGERVELVRGTLVVNTATTNGLGEWSFRGVESGEYIVRMNVRGRIAGVRVTVAAGQALNGTMIVVPAATASKQLGSIASLVAALGPTAAAASVSAATAAIQKTETAELSPALLKEILEAMPPAERKAFAEAVMGALGSQEAGNGTFTQYGVQFQQIINNPNVVPTFPPPNPVS